MTTSIVSHVREALQQLFDEAAADFPSEAKTIIEKDVIANTELVINALGFQELQNERAMERHIDSTIASAKYSVNRVLEQRRRLQ